MGERWNEFHRQARHEGCRATEAGEGDGQGQGTEAQRGAQQDVVAGEDAVVDLVEGPFDGSEQQGRDPDSQPPCPHGAA